MDKELPFSKTRPRTLPPEYQALLHSKCAHQIFEDTVARTPDAPAIVSAGRTFTYRQVDELADRLARQIVKLGLPVEALIGVYADRSPELLIAFTGILKAGCVYVPLDTQHPLERLKYMLDEMKAALVLTAGEEHPFGALPGTRFLSVAQCTAADPGKVPEHPRAVTPGNLAYGIFTSGSTGKPKGAMLEHRGLVNFCYYFKHFHGYKPGERCAQMVRPGFDASMSELAGFFFNGVCVCIPSNDVLANPARLVDFIVEHQVTRGFAPTPLGELLIEEEWPAQGVALIELQMGGEALRKRTTQRHSFQVTNVYGPTENTNISTVYRVENLEDDSRSIPIGFPVSNTEAIILTPDLKPVDPGGEGELFLGGVQLARCYLNRPDLTAEKFLPHPFDKTPGARLYRSGDLARYRADGAIEYISRIDFQVKIRGNRIELGEIENVLNALPGVKQAVVVPLMKDGKADSLAAFWTPDPAVATVNETLHESLARQLTSAMVPAHFVRLEKLPLSPNGKIDRRALPLELIAAEGANAPDDPAAKSAVALIAPSNALETALLEFWSAVLQRSDFGVRHNFIDIGGTSLVALRIVSQIHRKLKREVPVGQIYLSATIEKLAAFMSQAAQNNGTAARSKSCLIEIQPGRAGAAPIFCLHGFGGHIFQFYLLAKYLGPDVPVYALRGHGLEPGETPDDTCAKMAARYVDLILPAAKMRPCIWPDIPWVDSSRWRPRGCSWRKGIRSAWSASWTFMGRDIRSS